MEEMEEGWDEEIESAVNAAAEDIIIESDPIDGADDRIDAIEAFAAAGSRLTSRQRLWVEARLAGKSDLEAAKFAGYDSPGKAVASLRRNLDVAIVNQAAFAAAGMDIFGAARKIVKLTSAKTIKTATFEGQITDTMEIDDNKTQLEASLAVVRLSGMEPPKQSNITMDIHAKTTMIPEDYQSMSEADLLLLMQKQQIESVVRK